MYLPLQLPHYEDNLWITLFLRSGTTTLHNSPRWGDPDYLICPSVQLPQPETWCSKNQPQKFKFEVRFSGLSFWICGNKVTLNQDCMVFMLLSLQPGPSPSDLSLRPRNQRSQSPEVSTSGAFHMFILPACIFLAQKCRLKLIGFPSATPYCC